VGSPLVFVSAVLSMKLEMFWTSTMLVFFFSPSLLQRLSAKFKNPTLDGISIGWFVVLEFKRDI
jgi:hypothetical protein